MYRKSITVPKLSDDVEIRRELLQECLLSLLLFNLYSEEVLQEALEAVEIGIKINRVLINNVCYADDIMLIADNMQDLQRLINIVD